MRVFLEKYNDFGSILELNTENISTTIEIKREEISFEKVFISGKYQISIEGHFFGLFCSNKQMFLYFNNSVYSIQEIDIVKSYRNNREGVIFFDNYEIKYEVNLSVSTLTYTEDIEDSDFGLWICNILNSDERKSIFIEYNCGNLSD